MNPFHVVSRRGGIEDSVHIVHATVADRDGKVVAEWGDPSMTVLTRSAAKPFQAIPVVRAGVLEADGLGPAELAAVISSHNSEHFQVNVIERMAQTLGVSADELVCVPHRPLIKNLGYHIADDTAEATLAARGPLASNCSGKHTAMVALATAMGASRPGYEQPGHAVQQAGREAVAEFCGVDPATVREAWDGCGVVCWAVPLSSLATGYARLATSEEDTAIRVRSAMMQHPEFIAGTRRLCTAIMQHAPGRMLAKIGAGGVYGAAHVERGLGISIKVADGNAMAAGVALIAILDALDPPLGLADSLGGYARPAVLNTRCAVVGHYELGDDFSFV